MTMDSQTPSGIHEAGIFDLFRVVLRHWRLVLLVCVPVVAATVIWSLVMTKTYRAAASIVPPMDSMQGGDLGIAGGLLSGGEGALLRKAMNTPNVADIYVGILKSRAVLDTIVDRFNLVQVYGSSECPWRAVDRLRANTDIKVGEEGIVEISVVEEDPVRAAAIANAYVEELDRQNKRLFAGQATSKRLFLENRLKEIEEKFSRIETIPSHEAQVQEMIYELLIREYEMAKIEEARSMPTIQVLDEAVPPQQKFKPQRKPMVMMAAAGSFTLAVFLAFFLEYREETRQGGLARQFQRATRWRKTVARNRADKAGGNEDKGMVKEGTPGNGHLVAKS
jgi:uncharacterized protein involved in exopolysaccharide biosynthesis